MLVVPGLRVSIIGRRLGLPHRCVLGMFQIQVMLHITWALSDQMIGESST